MKGGSCSCFEAEHFVQMLLLTLKQSWREVCAKQYVVCVNRHLITETVP